MEVVKALLNHNAKIELKYNKRRTPLSFGIFKIFKKMKFCNILFIISFREWPH
jgi:hypothetical protein